MAFTQAVLAVSGFALQVREDGCYRVLSPAEVAMLAADPGGDEYLWDPAPAERIEQFRSVEDMGGPAVVFGASAPGLAVRFRLRGTTAWADAPVVQVGQVWAGDLDAQAELVRVTWDEGALEVELPGRSFP